MELGFTALGCTLASTVEATVSRGAAGRNDARQVTPVTVSRNPAVTSATESAACWWRFAPARASSHDTSSGALPPCSQDPVIQLNRARVLVTDAC